jgi:hypothetical protein
MPVLSMFYGLIVYLYYDDANKHHLPHIHVEYQGEEAVFSIKDGEVLKGSLPVNKRRMVQVWISLHEEELLANWKLAVAGEKPFRIEPLNL